MTMGMNDQSKPRSLTRSTKIDVLFLGLTGLILVSVAVWLFLTAETGFQTVSACFLAVAAVVPITRAIIALRQDDDIPSE
jgi:formate/nitrite transporter FocA (FNT family)